MATHDFSAETLKIRLICPFTFHDIKSKSDILIDSVVIKRLYAPDISRLKGELSSNGQDINGFMLGSKEMTEAYVDHFISEGKEVTAASNSALIMKMPFLNVFKINMFGMMLTRETSLLPTAYKCDTCKKTTIFNLDPSHPIPEDVEEDRDLQEDFLKFYRETWNKDALPGITVDLKDSPVKVEDMEGEPLNIFRLAVRWPTVGDYVRSSGDKKRSGDIELWTIFDCITQINDLTEEETKEIKNKNGCEAIMKFKASVYEKILADLNQFVVEVDHSFVCKHCGAENHQPFDYTNFFEFRRK